MFVARDSCGKIHRIVIIFFGSSLTGGVPTYAHDNHKRALCTNVSATSLHRTITISLNVSSARPCSAIITNLSRSARRADIRKIVQRSLSHDHTFFTEDGRRRWAQKRTNVRFGAIFCEISRICFDSDVSSVLLHLAGR